MTEINTNPIFVVGSPRSGTTLVSVMLGSHSLISIAPETHYFTRFHRKGQRHDCTKDAQSFIRFVEFFLDSEQLESFGFTEEERQAIIRQLGEGERSHCAVLSTVLGLYASKHGKAIFGEKTPTHALKLNEIVACFPDARVIFVVRDPRDVSLSMKGVPWGRGNLIEQLKDWQRTLNAVRRFEGAHQIYRLRYEDLLSGPDVALRGVCDYLELDYEDAMLCFHNNPDSVNFSTTTEPWKAKARTPIDRNNVGKWKRRMSAVEVAICERLVGDDLRQLGYEVAGIDSNIRTEINYQIMKVHNLLLLGQHWLRRISLRLADGY